MADILGLRGLQTISINTLIAAYGNGFINMGTGMGYGVPLSSTNNVEFELFLQSLFFQNYNDTPLTFNGSVWSRQHVAKLPLSKYIKQWDEAMYLGYIKIGSVEYPSRVWKSNLPVNNTIQWGYETGTNLTTTAGSPLIGSANSGFSTYGLRRGDPVFILSGNDIGEYAIQTIVSDQQLILTQSLKNTASGISFWAGGNWFDVLRDDGDFITWLGENDSLLTVYKRDSLHRYDGQNRVRIKDAVGTTSGRSVINMHELSLYFHGSSGLITGFYAYDGRDSLRMSAGVEKHIAGISSLMYNSIVAWRENDLYRAYVGDVVNTNFNINIPKAVFTWNYNTHTWSVDPIGDVIKVATEFRQSGVKQTYLGTNGSQVMITPSGTTFNSSPIPWRFDTKTLYPSGTEFTNIFNRVEIISENAKATQVKYRLHLNPFNTDENYTGLGQITNDKTIIWFPEQNNQASGINLQFLGDNTQEPIQLIKKITVYYKKENKTIY